MHSLDGASIKSQSSKPDLLEVGEKKEMTLTLSSGGLSAQPEPMTYKKTIMLGNKLRFLEDEWKLVDPIGEPGTFGVAYICHKIGEPDKLFVVKRINKAKFYHLNPTDRADIVGTLSNEINVQTHLKHKNICELYDVWEGRNYVDLIMEHLTGGELFDRINKTDGFTETDAAKIAKQILEAVAFMHSNDICHFDLKPDNILFATTDADSPIKVIDFGMAKALPRLKKLKQTVGTAYYMAPEVLKGQYDRSADVWSVGIIIFCMLFGFPPHYVDEDNIRIGDSEEEAIAELVKQGFFPEVRDGYGPWFPADVPVSDNVKDLLSKLLASDVKVRLTAEEALNHPWIRGETHAMQLPRTVFRSLTKFQKTNRFKLLVSRLFAQNLDPQRYAETIESFKKWDTDGDGQITLEEFRSGMKQATKLTNFEIDRIFRELDQDDNRLITLDEFIVSVAFDALVSVDERLANAFGELDKDGDGIIGVKELKDTIAQFDDLGRAESIMQEIDNNQDNQIDYQEFLRALHPTLNELEPSDMDRLRSRGFGSIDERSFNKYVRETKKQQLVDGLIDPGKLLKELKSIAIPHTPADATGDANDTRERRDSENARFNNTLTVIPPKVINPSHANLPQLKENSGEPNDPDDEDASDIGDDTSESENESENEQNDDGDDTNREEARQDQMRRRTTRRTARGGETEGSDTEDGAINETAPEKNKKTNNNLNVKSAWKRSKSPSLRGKRDTAGDASERQTLKSDGTTKGGEDEQEQNRSGGCCCLVM